ncbi:hypothetical protein [Streptomyces sp. DSM 41921]|uniref:Uncharacterized protein n=1 Tax=Streptomyces dubilierae TaxID=3075533 RepID=A0ABU2PHU2_9ACTN|nr:hypothetical protein [Streptomyces sp. DSM 41921]MDT0391736.1 hypothetical protein [Streptomyces sp. DSM 41921]
MKRRVQFTEQVARFRDYMPVADREKFLRLVDRIAAEPEGDDSLLAYTSDTVTREAWEDPVMVHYVVTTFFVVFIEADIHDAPRGFNEI